MDIGTGGGHQVRALRRRFAAAEHGRGTAAVLVGGTERYRHAVLDTVAAEVSGRGWDVVRADVARAPRTGRPLLALTGEATGGDWAEAARGASVVALAAIGTPPSTPAPGWELVAPGPMTPCDVLRVLAGHHDLPVASRLSGPVHALSGGVPELVRALVADGTRRGPGTRPAPGRAFRAAVLELFRAAGPDALAVARAVAELGDGASPARLAEHCGLTTGTVLRVRHALSADGLLVRGRLAHPAIGRALGAADGPGEPANTLVADLTGVLSPAEMRVAARAVLGESNGEIAATLRITRSTVEQHLTRVYGKLGVRGRRALGSRLLVQTSD